ncbi:MAG TPA: GGDEF domain-containing protein [Paucimonas sp.]|nr:GGDEF domain-containing protein [Paucimonas sp.]
MHLRATWFAAADYALNTLILCGFAVIGTVPFEVPLRVLAIAVVFNAVFVAGIVSGFTQRFRDPSMTALQVFAACGINLLALLLAPQIAYMAIVNLFVLLSYGSLHFSQRTFLFAWVALSVVLGIELRMVGAYVDIAATTGGERWFFWAVVTIALGRFLAIHAEVSRLRAGLHERNRELGLMAARMADLASRDELTGLWNRREFMHRLEEERKRIGRRGGRFCVALIDADHFKQVNDRFGHLAGDAVLRELAQVFDRTRRVSDTLARYGGEEFILLLLDVDLEAALPAVERMRGGVQSHDWSRIAPELQVTVSIGVASWRQNEDIGQVINRADAALYDAKAAGRNCVRAAPPERT